MAITLKGITELSLSGEGSFDTFMRAVRLHINDAVAKNELTQAQAGDIYASVIPGVLLESINFEFNKELKDVEIDIAKDVSYRQSKLSVIVNEALISDKDVILKQSEVADAQTNANILLQKLDTEKEKNGGGAWVLTYFKKYIDYTGETQYLPSTDTRTEITTTENMFKYVSSDGVWVETLETTPLGIVEDAEDTFNYQKTNGVVVTTQIPVVKFDDVTQHFEYGGLRSYIGQSYLLISGYKYSLAKGTTGDIHKVGTQVGWWDDLLASLITIDDYAQASARWLNSPHEIEFGGDGITLGSGKVDAFYDTDLGIIAGREARVKVDVPYVKSFTYPVLASAVVESRTFDSSAQGPSLISKQMEEVDAKKSLYKRQIQGFDEQRADKLLKMSVDMQSIYQSQNNGDTAPGSGFTIGNIGRTADGRANIYRTLMEGSIEFGDLAGSTAATIKSYNN